MTNKIKTFKTKVFSLDTFNNKLKASEIESTTLNNLSYRKQIQNAYLLFNYKR